MRCARLLGCFVLILAPAAAPVVWAQAASPPQSGESERTIEYVNREYGFRFRLPRSWAGYSIVSSRPAPFKVLLIRHPRWTEAAPREDIPIMIFTPEQWTQIQQEKLIVSAAPFPPSELGRNQRYVFALPPRFDFDQLEGWQEVVQIIRSHSLQAF